jgi:hypothetical protein
MRFINGFIIALLLITCDNKELVVTDVCPSCFSDLISSSNPPLEIWAYKYNNQIVYLALADCCDQYDFLYNSNCNQLCAPSGGFSGIGDGKCADFHDKATDGKLVWKKE